MKHIYYPILLFLIAVIPLSSQENYILKYDFLQSPLSYNNLTPETSFPGSYPRKDIIFPAVQEESDTIKMNYNKTGKGFLIGAGIGFLFGFLVIGDTEDISGIQYGTYMAAYGGLGLGTLGFTTDLIDFFNRKAKAKK